jgi:large subunit ribosomal protein L29
MRADEIREMSIEDITKRVAELEEEQFRLKFRSATEPLEDPLKLRVIRRSVARLKTILRQQQDAQKASQPSAPKKVAKSATTSGTKPAAKKKSAGKTASAARG